ncbi:TIR domain-containing protein [Ruminococcaceae bacterium YRB3002]|nr:TIR domain-containing protein [Ruminococcaceae bacterium YRB3002]
MSTLKCKMCGGTIDFEQGTTVITCEYCGTKQTLPRLDDDRKANLYDRANHFRRNNEYDKAMSIYEQILNEDNTDAESYWSIVLCKYGIEYVEDPATHKRVPTVNRAQFTSVIADEDYKKALEYADIEQKIIYEAEAKAIDEIQKGILEISQKEEPFDVFICYKETDSNGRRTQDSVLANDLYHQLTQEGFKVFFSRITLEDKLGTAYEPYIFAALNSAKVMVVLGTKAEFFNAVWVKNEWSRYLALIRKGEKKMLIPAYRDMDPYDLPEEFSHLQAQDMSKLGFMQDLIRGIKKIIGDSQPKAAAQTIVNNNYSSNVTALLKRGQMQLEDGEWEKADEFYEEVLNQDAECAEAFLGKFFAANKVQGLEEYKKRLLDQTSVVEPNNERISKEDKDHIESMVGSCTVKGYLEPDVIRKMYKYDRTHEITTPIRIKQKESVLSELNNDRMFSRASKFAQGTTKEAIDAFVDELTEQLDIRIEQAKTSDAQSVMASEEAYAAFISEADSKVLNMCESEKARKQKDYRAIVEKGRTCKTSEECASAIKCLGGVGCYEDADAVIEELNSRCKELKEAEEKAQKKKQNKTRNIVIIVASIVAVVVIAVLSVTVFIPYDRYNKAVELYNSGNYSEAKTLFSELGDYKESPYYVKTISLLLSGIDKETAEKLFELQEGDVISFGDYHGANEWLVLEVKGTSIHLLSQKAIDCRRFDDNDNNWKNSEIRKWLNDEYYTEAFSDIEKGIIMETEGVKVTLLTVDEARNFLTHDMMLAEPTKYAVSQGVLYAPDNHCIWWLRSPGRSSGRAACVDFDGNVGEGGSFVDDDYIGVRPALWINLES